MPSLIPTIPYSKRFRHPPDPADIPGIEVGGQAELCVVRHGNDFLFGRETASPGPQGQRFHCEIRPSREVTSVRYRRLVKTIRQVRGGHRPGLPWHPRSTRSLHQLDPHHLPCRWHSPVVPTLTPSCIPSANNQFRCGLATSFSTNSSWTPSCTNRRLEHTQVCPALRYFGNQGPLQRQHPGPRHRTR